jgi:hypothetical protein
MNNLLALKKACLSYPWARAKRSFLAMGLCMVLSAPGWMALRQTDKGLSVLFKNSRQEMEAAVFFVNVLDEHKGLKETYGRRKTGEISLMTLKRTACAGKKREDC